jgi:hypothetical protein
MHPQKREKLIKAQIEILEARLDALRRELRQLDLPHPPVYANYPSTASLHDVLPTRVALALTRTHNYCYTDRTPLETIEQLNDWFMSEGIDAWKALLTLPHAHVGVKTAYVIWYFLNQRHELPDELLAEFERAISEWTY